MKHIYLNLKRFDIPKSLGGVNAIAEPMDWGKYIIENTQEALQAYDGVQVVFVMYFPEAHIISAVQAQINKSIKIGCQGVYREDTEVGGNFGAFTSNRTGNAMKSIGCYGSIIGHCEERKDKAGILSEADVVDVDAVNRILNKEIKAAIASGLRVLYCIGEKADEQEIWQEVIRKQLVIGLQDVDLSKVTIAYEPVWAIGPGKTPPDKAYIQKIARFVKSEIKDVDVTYGGGLKLENAKMLASIEEIDGGLIALTRFQGDIGFYPEEYLNIIKAYLEN